jgi:hypothetical protein
VFLRLPKGVKTRAERKLFSNQAYYHYAREGNDAPFLEVLVVGVSPPAAASETHPVLRTEKMPTKSENLAEKVLERYGLRESAGTIPVRRLGRSVLRVQTFTIDKPSYSVTGYLDQEEGNQLAIVFHIDKTRKDEGTEKLMRTVLRSLGVGPDADKARSMYERRHKPSASGKAPTRP